MPIKNFVLVVLFILPLFAIAQTITGTVKDKDGESLPYVRVTEKGATNKTITKEDGSFSLRVSMLPTKLIFKSVGYKDVMVAIPNKDAVSVTMERKETILKENINVGNISKSKTLLETPVAVKYISAADLQKTGKLTLDKILAYSETSLNSTNQPHADATTHFDMTDLKGLGSSRMLVLVNGKRKNLTAIAHINETYGKGEVGTDLNSIPVAAIDHIEILKEGASSIYGSDAMAGVINVVLKKITNEAVVRVNSGITTKGDGLEAGGDVNGTFANKNNTFINYTVGVQYQDYTDRPEEEQMIVGQPGMFTGNVYFNAAKPFKNGKGELYATLGGEVRKGKSFIYDSTLYPELKTAIVDNMDVFGVKYNTNGYKMDLSGTFGINKTSFFVENSTNLSMGGDSPSEFDNGNYRFYNTVVNFDVKKSFDKLNFTFGAEYKMEDYKISQGEYESWFNSGSIGFSGINHNQKLNEDRNSYAALLDLGYNVTDDFLIGASARYDDYSDLNDAQVSYKANARYKFGDKGAIRASYGTSFRAPALQQMYLNYEQFYGSRILNSTDRATYGIANLEAETATNINVGFTFIPMKNLSLGLDYYKVDIDNRVALTNDVTVGLDTFKFFTNAYSTETQGIDFTAKYDNIRFPSGVLAFTLAANWNDTAIASINDNPSSLASYELFNRTERSRIETGRPDIRGSFGINYAQASWDVSLNNNYFGEVTWQHPTDITKDQTFAAKFLTDLVLNYQISKVFEFNLAVNNILNVYPDELSGDAGLDMGGRFVYPYQVSQFGINGTNVRAGITARF